MGSHEACAHKSVQLQACVETQVWLMSLLWFRCAGSLNWPGSKCPLYHNIAPALKSLHMFSNRQLQLCKYDLNVVDIVGEVCWFFFSFHRKALEVLQGYFQPLWLDFSHPFSSVRHSHHAQCRKFSKLASRGNGGFIFLDWIASLSAEVFSTDLITVI